MVWTQEDIDKVRKFIDIKNRGHYAETHELTDVYNRVLEKRVTNTTCGSCLRQRVIELEKALRQYEAQLMKQQENNVTPEKEQPLEAKEETKDVTSGETPKPSKKGKKSKPKAT